MVWATMAGIVAVAQNRPAGFAGQATGLSAWWDFALGLGTALSPPVWWIAIQALLTSWVPRSDRLGRIGRSGLVLFGVAECVGALGEPITYAIFAPGTFNAGLAGIQAGMIVLPAVMAVAGVRTMKKVGPDVRAQPSRR
jgi:hypothetical protein